MNEAQGWRYLQTLLSRSHERRCMIFSLDPKSKLSCNLHNTLANFSVN
jgi:hypothetical protein